MSDNVTNHTNAKWEEGLFFVIKTSWINFCKTHTWKNKIKLLILVICDITLLNDWMYHTR